MPDGASAESVRYSFFWIDGWRWYDRSYRIDQVSEPDKALTVLHHGHGGPNYEHIGWSTIHMTGGENWSFSSTLAWCLNHPDSGDSVRFFHTAFPHVSRTTNVMFLDGHVETHAPEEDFWHRPLYWRGY